MLELALACSDTGRKIYESVKVYHVHSTCKQADNFIFNMQTILTKKVFCNQRCTCTQDIYHIKQKDSPRKWGKYAVVSSRKEKFAEFMRPCSSHHCGQIEELGPLVSETSVNWLNSLGLKSFIEHLRVC